MSRIRRVLCSAVGLLWAIGEAAGAQAHDDSTQWLTFIEVRVEARGHAANIFRGWEHATSPARTIFLQEVSRPERFALMEDVQSMPADDAAEMDTLRAAIGDELIAPLDRRANREFEPDTGAKGTRVGVRTRVDAHAHFYVIAHLDLATRDPTRVEAALHQFAAAARASDGNLGFEVWQQTERPNHFNLISALVGESPLHAFEASHAAREFRQLVGPLLGSPYDERLYRRAD